MFIKSNQNVFTPYGSISYNTIKDPHRYAVQGSDTTMLSSEPSARTKKQTIFTGTLLIIKPETMRPLIYSPRH